MSITPFNSVGGYSTGLTGYTVIDAVGGVSAAGGTFSALTRFTAGISASGGTFSGDIAVNGGDITTTATTATIFNSTATTVSMGGANDSTINIGAGTGVTLNIGTGSLFGGTKNINIGTNGSFGTSIIQIGNSIAAITINSGTAGITLGSGTSPIRIPNTLTVGGGATLGGRVDVGGVLDVVGGVTFESTSDHVGVARFAGGVTFASTSDHTGAARFASTTAFSGLMTFTAGLSGNGMTLSGNLSAATKSFVIPHPTKPQMTLQHGSLEGPENGVYVRGRLRGNDTITLPEYWRGLVHEDSITANLTEIGDRNHHWVAYMSDYTITVASERGSVDCFYTVWGERKDVGKLPVEY
jgi:hypothetical protein